MTNEEWQTNFRAVWDRAVTAWKEGKRSAGAMFEVEDVMFLFSTGCLPQEMFDFVDDAMSYDDVTYETVLEVTSVRRDYFLNVLGGMRSGVVVPMEALPPKTALIDGIAWLPRLIAKARLKLRGEMNPDLMYGCAGDRPFLKSYGWTLGGFLKVVWEKGADDAAIVSALKTGPANA